MKLYFCFTEFATIIFNFSLQHIRQYRWQHGTYESPLGTTRQSQLDCLQQDVNYGPQACSLKNLLLSTLPTTVNTKIQCCNDQALGDARAHDVS